MPAHDEEISPAQSQTHPASQVDPHPWTRRLGVLLTLATFLLIGTGGLVTSYNAGLAVPDWPASFGRWFLLPARIWADLAVMLEHNHRLTGAFSGLICMAAVVAAVRTFGWRSPIGDLAVLVLVLFIYQGVMGGIRVVIVEKYPEWSVPFAIIHGVQGQLLFMLVIWLAACLGRYREKIKAAVGDADGRVISGAVYALCWVFVILLVMQLTIGAVVRHTNSASAIPDAPAVYGGFFPPSDEAVIAEKFYELGGGEWWVYEKEPALPMDAVKSETTPDLLDKTRRVPATPPSVGLIHNQYLHRVMGMVILPVVGFGLIHLLMRYYKVVPGLRGPVVAGSVLFVLQVLLGMSVIWSKESPHVASSHQAMGAALLGVSTLVLIRVHWVRKLAGKSGGNPGEGPMSDW